MTAIIYILKQYIHRKFIIQIAIISKHNLKSNNYRTIMENRRNLNFVQLFQYSAFNFM